MRSETSELHVNHGSTLLDPQVFVNAVVKLVGLYYMASAILWLPDLVYRWYHIVVLKTQTFSMDQQLTINASLFTMTIGACAVIYSKAIVQLLFAFDKTTPFMSEDEAVVVEGTMPEVS